MKVELTKTYIDEKVDRPKSGYVVHWDTKTAGFGLRVTSGGKRVFIAVGRVNGKPVWKTIGAYGVFTIKQAREAAEDELRGMRKGVNPHVVAREQKVAAVSLADVNTAYMRDRALKQSTREAITYHMDKTFIAWQTRPMMSISRHEITTRFNEVKDNGLRGTRGSPGQANQAFAILRAHYNYAIREYRKPDGSAIITDNPVDVLYKKWAKLKPRTSRIPDKKLGACWLYLVDSRAAAYNRDTWSSTDLVIFLLLTGTRLSEAAALTWDRVNLEEGWFHIPAPKNDNAVWLPLSSQATEMLSTRQRIKGNNHVFPSWGKSGHLRDPRDAMKKLTAIAGTKITPHDLRRTFTTVAIAHCGVEIQKAELLTNHVPKTVTARHYLETNHLEYLKPETQRVSDYIERCASIARAQASGANVITLKAG